MLVAALTQLLAFTPQPLTGLRPACRRTVDPVCHAGPPRPSLAAIASSALLAYHPLAAMAEQTIDSYYMSASDEKAQLYVLGFIAVVVLTSPIIGIQMARGAISSMADDEMKSELRSGKDPEWKVTPDAKRKKQQRDLQARLAAEMSNKGWFGR
jgi:hypothetical protein